MAIVNNKSLFEIMQLSDEEVVKRLRELGYEIIYVPMARLPDYTTKGGAGISYSYEDARTVLERHERQLHISRELHRRK